jgi:hypothetical protein
MMRREHWHLFLVAALMATLGSVTADARAKRAPVIPEPEPTPEVTVSPEPKPSALPQPGEALAYFGPGAHSSLKQGGIDYAYGQRTLAHLNGAYNSGCLLEKALAWDFLSLHGVVNPALKKYQKLEAYQRFTAGAPYALDARWYSTWGSVVGYTYNFKDGYESGPSETRVWTNTRMNLSDEDYAAHLAHELSHQARAGGFVHYSFHQGSFPYEIGDIVWACILERAEMRLTLAESETPKRKRRKILDHSGCYQ